MSEKKDNRKRSKGRRVRIVRFDNGEEQYLYSSDLLWGPAYAETLALYLLRKPSEALNSDQPYVRESDESRFGVRVTVVPEEVLAPVTHLEPRRADNRHITRGTVFVPVVGATPAALEPQALNSPPATDDEIDSVVRLLRYFLGLPAEPAQLEGGAA